MRLSEAIRLGSMMQPQGFGGYYVSGSCALGAAADAAGLPRCLDDETGKEFPNYVAIRRRFPELRQLLACPACTIQSDGACLVWHINDEHRWSRERIASWVESIESQQPTAPPVEVACEPEVAV